MLRGWDQDVLVPRWFLWAAWIGIGTTIINGAVTAFLWMVGA